MFIANALYFKDSWLYTFEDEDFNGNPVTGAFNYIDGKQETLDMMQLTSTYIKYEHFTLEKLNGKSFEVVIIPYKNRKFQMRIMMPAGEAKHLEWLEDFTAMTFARDLRTEQDFNLFRYVNDEDFDGVCKETYKNKTKAKNFYISRKSSSGCLSSSSRPKFRPKTCS